MNSLSMTGLILAGGQGSRMGGEDKGLQLFNGKPLAMHAIERLQMQEGASLSSLMIAANRNVPAYEALGVPVWTDIEDAGPLAGMLTGLAHCPTDLLLTVPCDSPFLPLHLAHDLCQALLQHQAKMAVAATYEADGSMHMQPVFCLMRANLRNSLLQFIHQGGRKLGTWAASQEAVWVPFEEPSIQMAGPAPNKQLPHLTYPNAFCNVNTLEDLHRLEQSL